MSSGCTVQDIFHRFYPAYESSHNVSPAQRKAAYHIMNCKTGAFGVNAGRMWELRLHIHPLSLLPRQVLSHVPGVPKRKMG